MMTPSELQGQIDELELAARLPPKERPDVTPQVDALCNYQEGLPSASIVRIVRIVAHSRLDLGSSKLLVDNLFPSELISKDVVYSIVAAIGSGAPKPAPAVQAQLLRWLALVRDALENRNVLAHVYAVLFNFIDFLAIRADLCHLLAMITERRHVKQFRVNVLLQMQARMGSDPAIRSLLKTFRSFRPELVPDEAISGRASVVAAPNEEWSTRMEVIRESQQEAAGLEDDAQFRVLSKTVARSKASHIPLVHTSQGPEDTRERLEDVNGIEDFAEKMSKLRLPDQMAAAMTDPLLQHYLEATPIEHADGYVKEVNKEIARALNAQLELLKLGERLDKGCVEILRAGLAWAQRFKHLLSSIEKFCLEVLKTSLEIWRPHAELFAGLLSWSNPYSEADWSQGLLESTLESRVIEIEHGQILLLSTYTQMIHNRIPGISTTVTDRESFHALDVFVDHVSTLALSVLATNDSARSHLAVTSYLQALANIATTTSIPNRLYALVTFDRHVIYLLAFSCPNISILSQLCGALADQKEAIFQVAGDGKDLLLRPGLVSTFNGFIMDISNLLWRCRAFCTDSKQDLNAKACMLDDDSVAALQSYVSHIPTGGSGFSLMNFFMFSFHPALANIAAAAWRGLEKDELAKKQPHLANSIDMDVDEVRHRGPVSRMSLQRLLAEGGARVDWLTYRLQVMQLAGECGAPGVDRLMKRTIKALMPDVLAPHSLSSSQVDSPLQL